MKIKAEVPHKKFRILTMRTFSTAIVTVFAAALSQGSVEAFSYYSNSKQVVSVARAGLQPLYYKDELVPDVENEILVSKRGKKGCCNGCAGCPFADDTGNTEPNVVKVSSEEVAPSKEATIDTNYQDATGEGLPLFKMAGNVGWSTMCEIHGYISLKA
eukprot:68540_1